MPTWYAEVLRVPLHLCHSSHEVVQLLLQPHHVLQTKGGPNLREDAQGCCSTGLPHASIPTVAGQQLAQQAIASSVHGNDSACSAVCLQRTRLRFSPAAS